VVLHGHPVHIAPADLADRVLADALAGHWVDGAVLEIAQGGASVYCFLDHVAQRGGLHRHVFLSHPSW
jgi:hypothetical protein